MFSTSAYCLDTWQQILTAYLISFLEKDMRYYLILSSEEDSSNDGELPPREISRRSPSSETNQSRSPLPRPTPENIEIRLNGLALHDPQPMPELNTIVLLFFCAWICISQRTGPR